MIVIINFSNRNNGNGIAIAKVIGEHYYNKEVKVFNFDSLKVEPCGHCNYECLKETKHCPISDDINSIYQAIIKSELALFIIPNYCDYPCSNFFIFNERSCGFFKQNAGILDTYNKINKKFIIISNSNVQNFKKVLKYQITDGEPDTLFLSSKKINKCSLDGDLMETESARLLVINFLNDCYKLEESAMAIVFCGNKVLVTNEYVYGKATLSLPKGHIENKETHIDAAIRECFEETDVKLSRDDFIKEITPFEIRFIDHHNVFVKKIIYPVVFRINNEITTTAKEERIREVLFMDVVSFFKKCSYDNVREVIINAVESIKPK